MSLSHWSLSCPPSRVASGAYGFGVSFQSTISPMRHTIGATLAAAPATRAYTEPVGDRHGSS